MKSDDTANNYSHFTNKNCEFFPCHKTDNNDSFNCLFCYCPLYALGDQCGGSFSHTPEGIKDCSNCVIPHTKGGYDYIRKNINLIVELVRQGKPEEGQE
ncbi:MAG: cysteine-rich small domain-containing protein [Oscillospiraceae bacterium]|nr:cysteine-rich small domain-containing protein [Oscillospiraceae bacterium]